MAKVYDTLTPADLAFIEEQPLFFVATAPPGEGRINLSPKGYDTFRVLDPKRVAYLDLTGSGNETAAHVLAEGRITVMFCSFGPKPLILRLYGRARQAEDGEAEVFSDLPGRRQVFLIDVESVQRSCGFGVPRMDLIEPRSLLVEWAETKGPDGLEAYRAEKNRVSLDGLPTSRAPNPR